jgi:hypothetical protein
MARLRREFSLARLVAAIMVVAVPSAWARPRPVAAVLAVGLLIPILVEGLTALEAGHGAARRCVRAQHAGSRALHNGTPGKWAKSPALLGTG